MVFTSFRDLMGGLGPLQWQNVKLSSGFLNPKRNIANEIVEAEKFARFWHRENAME